MIVLQLEPRVEIYETAGESLLNIELRCGLLF